MTPFPYQQLGIDFLKSHPKAFLFDDPGLGKTAQGLLAIDVSRPPLVICPKAAKSVWETEAAKFRPDLKPVTITGRKNFKWPTPGELVIVNPDIFPSVILGCPSGLQVLVDECHMFKSPKSDRSKRLQSLSHYVSGSCGSVWGFTGTPVLTSPLDLWGLLYSLDLIPETYKTWINFKRLFRGFDVQFSKFVKVTKFPSTPLPGAMEPLAPYVLRRKREQVLPELPTKRYETYKVETNYKSQIQISEEDINPFHTGREHIATWRREVSEAKAKACLDYIKQLAEDQQLVIFTCFRRTARLLAEGDGVLLIDGESSSAHRQEAARSFQSGLCRVLVGTIGAMGVAVTLTASHRVIFIDRDWTPAMNKQAEDRVCRIGQTRGVIVTDVICNDPVDQIVTKVLVKKTQLIENTIEVL